MVLSSSSGSDLVLQPVSNAHGNSEIFVEVMDERGNQWSDSFTVNVAEVPDGPTISGLPLSVYMELGEDLVIEMTISDPDTDTPSVMTSKSWATVGSDGNLLLSPVAVGTHIVEVTVSDGVNQISQQLEVIVTAKPDLIVESVTVESSTSSGSKLRDGDVARISIFVRNQGMGDAVGVEVRCLVDDVFVGTTVIDAVESGGLGEASCDAALSGPGTQLIRVVADGTNSIRETNEDNNEKSIQVEVSERESNSNEDSGVDRGPAIIVGSVGLIAIAITALRLGPGRVKKPYDKRGK